MGYRKYFKGKASKFVQWAEKHGAKYIDESGDAIFSTDKWVNYSGTVDEDYYCPAVCVTNNKTPIIILGQLKKSCDNFEYGESFHSKFTVDEGKQLHALLGKIIKALKELE